MESSKSSEKPIRGGPSVDRISVLPESLLCHILSFLPTHYAVQTSVVSKRWRHLWTSITSLHFNEMLFYGGDGEKASTKFEQFVTGVLVHLRTPCLEKFELSCLYVRDPFHVNTWASAALSRNVREFSLNVYLPESFEIPVSIFTSKTLSYLSLCCDTTLNVPNSVCLPNLKYIHLSGINYANDESVRKLISGCSALEELSVEREIWGHSTDNVFHFRISSPTLKCLKIKFFSYGLLARSQHTLEIDAPMLQYLSLDDCLSSDYVTGNLSSLIEARINFHVCGRNTGENGYGDKVMKLFQGLSYIKFLELSGATLKALSNALEHAPDLGRLPVSEGLVRTSKHDAWSIQPDHAPKCLLSCLTTVEINDFDGSSSEIMMVKYILNGAKSLERMTIFTSVPQAKLDLHQEMTMFPGILNFMDSSLGQ